MGALLLHILFVAIGAIVGAATGWLLRGGGEKKSTENTRQIPVAVTAPKATESEKAFDHVEAVMSRLHQLTASVAADVGEHSNRVQAINDELTSGGDVVTVVERLMKVNEQMQSQLQAAEQRMQQQASEIESHVKEARTDALTKLANRRAFDDEIRRCVDSLKTKGQTSCMMMIDVDHFKKFNDVYGHQAGDEVLRNVGRILRREATGKEIVCRYGGEEFVVIYPGMDLNGTIPLAEKARSAIALDIVEFQGLDLKVTASGGVAQLKADESGEDLVKRADVALYVCKEKGRNCGYWHDGSTSQPMKEFSPLEHRQHDSSSHAAELVFKLTDDTESPKAHRRDRVTGMSDSETFCCDVDRRLAEFQRERVPTSLVFIAIDNSQRIAELYGTKAVELAMRTAAQIIKATMREMDHAALYTSNVFSLMLPGSTAAEASSIAERIRVAIEACPLPVNGEDMRFTCSMGITEFQPNDEREHVLSRGDRSLEEAIKAGGNRTMAIDANGKFHAMAIATANL
jgi:diguanylate cyclase